MQKTLDVLAADSADFIKVDIEGYEYEALRGGRAVLESHPIMFVEVHPKEVRNNGSSATEVLSLLSRHYSNIEIYEELKSARILTRILQAYGVVDRLHRVTDHSRYLKRCENGEIVQPFWAVAKPPH
jgi:hypothetical protein